jgi:hypothetical protein
LQVVTDFLSTDWICMAALPEQEQQEALPAALAFVQHIHNSLNIVLGDCQSTNLMLRRKPGSAAWAEVEIMAVDLDCESN